MIIKNLPCLSAVLGAALLASASANVAAQTFFTITSPAADAFVTSGPAGNDLSDRNFGAVGTLAIAPAGSANGRFDSVMKFNAAGAMNLFNGTYGVGNWRITGVELRLASNFGEQGEQPNNSLFGTINAGQFTIDHVNNDSWVEGVGGASGGPGYPDNSSVSLSYIPTLFAGGSTALGTFSYAPPGDDIYRGYSLPLAAGLVSDVAAGGDITFYLAAADSQVNYLFNSRSFSRNHPELVITTVPEPAASLWVALALGGCAVWRFRQRMILRLEKRCVCKPEFTRRAS